MNATQIGGLIRTWVPAAVAYLVGVGVVPAGWEAAAVGLGVPIALGIWSYLSNSTIAVVTQAAKSDEVHEIIASPALSEAVSSDKVVPK